MVICLERGANLHNNMALLMPLPLTFSCFSKIHIGFTFLVPAHPSSHRKRTVKGAYVLRNIFYIIQEPRIDNEKSVKVNVCGANMQQTFVASFLQ